MKVEVDVLGSLPVPDSVYGLCGRRATLKKKNCGGFRAKKLYEKSRWTSWALPVPDSVYGLCGRKVTLK